jgi:hypothetical protein
MATKKKVVKRVKKEFIKSYLPLFMGFSDTIFSPDDVIDREIELYNNTNPIEKVYEDFDFYIDEYKDKVGIACTKQIDFELNQLGFDVDIDFIAVSSPRFYNFENDSFNVAYQLKNNCIDKIKSYLENNYDSFELYIKKRFSHRCGFISNYCNNAKDLLDKINIESFKSDFNLSGTIFDFILTNEKYTYEDLYYDSSICDIELEYELNIFNIHDLYGDTLNKVIEIYRSYLAYKNENDGYVNNYLTDIQIIDLIENDNLFFDANGNILDNPEIQNFQQISNPNQLKLEF